jgi:hypothetical protein
MMQKKKKTLEKVRKLSKETGMKIINTQLGVVQQQRQVVTPMEAVIPDDRQAG